ncbi:MAG: 2-C-methyl-D-erythritol 4-phosphate cytidylyltransferase [Eubacteriales bacterium]|nr:2-C-methyl-D-erythritol 4-phosphate cytidylyltransferase [Eubacteriales bacterium]
MEELETMVKPKKNRKDRKKTVTAIVLAAGSGSRMNSSVKKQYMEIKNVPVIIHTLRAFEKSKYIDQVVLVVGENDIQFALDMCIKYEIRKVKNIVEGGNMRFRSVYKGLCEVPPETTHVMIHDGARPLISQEIIKDIYYAMSEYKAAIVGVPVKDTIKTIDRDGFTDETLDRSALYAVQTPQAFEYELIMKAYENLFKTIEIYHSDENMITDDAVIVENMSDTRVKIIKGDYKNIKITTPEDLVLAEAFLSLDKNI